MILAAALLFTVAPPAAAQINWPCDALPCLSDPALNGVAHDALHSVEAIGIAEGLRLIDRDWKESDRYLIATVAFPVLQELIDLAFVSDRELKEDRPSNQSLMDLPTYQGAWILPLVREKKWWQAALLTVAWGGYIYFRYYGEG